MKRLLVCCALILIPVAAFGQAKGAEPVKIQPGEFVTGTGLARGALYVTTIGNLGGGAAAALPGWGVPAIVARARHTGKTAAVNPITSYTVDYDGTFEIMGTLTITTSNTFDIYIEATYTDETNASRTIALLFMTTTTYSHVGNAQGAGAYPALPSMIRAKAGTTITVFTYGTFTNVVYNVEGIIRRVN